MKKLTTLFTTLLITTISFSQNENCDDLIFKNGEEIYGLISEITTSEVKYKRCDNPEGPTFSLEKSKLLMIRYKNGTKDVFNSTEINSPGLNSSSKVGSESKTKRNKGYIGISLGSSVPTGTFSTGGSSPSAGFAMNLLTLGYRFTDNIGITLNWGANGFSSYDLDVISVAFGYLAIGPMITIPTGSLVSIDIKPQYAFAYGSIDYSDYASNYDLEYTGGSALLIGTSINFDFGKKIGVSFDTDFLSIFNFNDVILTEGPNSGISLGPTYFIANVTSISFKAGVQFRF